MSLINKSLISYNSHCDIANFKKLEAENIGDSDINIRNETHATEDALLCSNADNACKNITIKDIEILIPTTENNYHVNIEYIKMEKLSISDVNIEICNNDEITEAYIESLHADQLLSISTISKRTLFQNISYDPSLIMALTRKLKFLLDSQDITVKDIMACLMYECDQLTALTEAAPYDGSLTAFADLIGALNLLDSNKNIYDMFNFVSISIKYLKERLYIDNYINIETAYCINNLRNFGIKLGLFAAPLIP